ncbi:hypothetical protein Tco_1295443 [Tanacetum coccineum]
MLRKGSIFSKESIKKSWGKESADEIGKSIVELHATLKLHEEGIPKKAETLIVLAIWEGKIQKDKKKLKGAKGKDNGKNKLAYAPNPKIR